MKIISYLQLIRFNKPTGTLLLFLPCLFAISLIKKIDFLQESKLITLFFLGSLLMRSAGCIINDIMDYKFDRKISRTSNRPIANGKITKKRAMFLLVILLFISFLILLQFNKYTILSGFFIISFIAIYPLMKRITYYPQIFLGITINFGVVMASLALDHVISYDICLLYLICILWTIFYDTVYAFQDIEGDLSAGVKSMALKLQKSPKSFFLTLAIIMAAMLFYLGYLNNFSSIFFVITAINFLIIINKIKKCDYKNPQNCLKLFNYNIIFGLIMLLSLIFS